MRAWCLGILAAAVLALSSGCTHAGPLGLNRPAIGPPVRGACWPLPAAPHLQMQRVSDLLRGPVRIYRLQYDRVSADTARRRVAESLTAAGFTDARPPATVRPSSLGLAQAQRAGIAWFHRADFGAVGVSAFPIPDTEGYLVHGILVLVLPASTAATAPARCTPPLAAGSAS